MNQKNRAQLKRNQRKNPLFDYPTFQQRSTFASTANEHFIGIKILINVKIHVWFYLIKLKPLELSNPHVDLLKQEVTSEPTKYAAV